MESMVYRKVSDRNQKGKSNRRNRNHPPSRNEGRKGKNHPHQSVHHHLLPKLIPRWKLILLRHAYDDDQIVEFLPHSNFSYQTDDDSKSYYNIQCINPTNDRQEEIKEIAAIFQQWTEDVMMKRMDSTASDDLWISVRYGCLYLTSLNPYVDIMPVKEFKQQFNVSLKCNRRKHDNHPVQHHFRTGFFPIYNHFPSQIQSLDGSQFIFDNMIERFRIIIDNDDAATLDYVEYDAEMELLNGRQDEKYLKLDIKDNLSANDARLCINGSKENDMENMPSQLRDMMTDSWPPILRDSCNDRIVVRSEYRQSIGSLRHKKIKSYKLTTDVELWDAFRQATTVKLSHVDEYLNPDQSTGQFKERNEKTEINVEVHSLKQLLNDQNCQLLAENLHRLIFTILPQYLSGSDS